jgi:hypothetical protein
VAEEAVEVELVVVVVELLLEQAAVSINKTNILAKISIEYFFISVISLFPP